MTHHGDEPRFLYRNTKTKALLMLAEIASPQGDDFLVLISLHDGGTVATGENIRDLFDFDEELTVEPVYTRVMLEHRRKVWEG